MKMHRWINAVRPQQHPASGLIVLIAALSLLAYTTATAQIDRAAARTNPPGHGPVLRFRLATSPDEQRVRISFDDVAAQMHDGQLVVNFKRIVFERVPDWRTPIQFRRFTIRIFKETANGSLAGVKGTDDQPLRRIVVNRHRAQVSTGPIEVAIPGAAAACLRGCVIRIAVAYYGIVGLDPLTDMFYKGESTVETLPVFLRFDEKALAVEWPVPAHLKRWMEAGTRR